MKSLLILALFLGACADSGITTKVSENGQTVLATGANAATLHFRTPNGTQLDATGLDHSSPILANGAGTALIIDATGRVIGIVANGVTTWLLAGANPTTAAVASGVPATINQVRSTVNPPVNMEIRQQWVSQSARHKRHHRHKSNDSPPKD